MALQTAQDVMVRCDTLAKYWAPRNAKMKEWYRLIEMVDELKTEKMESFVGNDPRSMFNLVLHLLDSDMPHRIKNTDLMEQSQADAASKVSDMLKIAWEDNETRFRKTGPHQSMKRYTIALMLATGWYSVFAITSDDGTRCWADPWNPAEVYPAWDDMGQSEVAHIFELDVERAKGLCLRNGWSFEVSAGSRNFTIYDYWWMDYNTSWQPICWNAVVVGGKLVKLMPTRFKHIPIYVAPVGGLPDMGPLTDTNSYGVSGSYNAGARVKSDRWKAEIGQAIVATNEHIYKSWNKWWTYGLQLLRDTAQPRIFERSQSGKVIIKPEDIWKRGAIFKGGPNDSLEFLSPPPIPLELRSSQLDLEAMMQRGGVSWAMYGSVQGQMSAYVMSQIAASANQIMKPFHQANINLHSDIDNDWVEDAKERSLQLYGIAIPTNLPPHVRVSAEYEIEIPGDLVQRATVARMLNPNFRLSYSYVVQKLFPEIRNPLREKALQRADDAEGNPINAAIAYIQFCRRQARYLTKLGDTESAELYELAAQTSMALLKPPQQAAPQQPAAPGVRPEVRPPPAETVETPV